MDPENDRGWKSITVTFFCLLASFEAAYRMKEMVTHLSGLQALAYAFGEGIFVALSTVFLYYFLMSLGDK